LKPWLAESLISYCRAYPDEKGIETHIRGIKRSPRRYDCRAYPDEKGIETSRSSMPQVIPVPIAEPIPMKRELKRFLQTNGTILVQTKLQSLSR